MPNPLSIYPEYLTDTHVLICPSDPEGEAVLEPEQNGNWVADSGSTPPASPGDGRYGELDIDPNTGCGKFADQGDSSYTYIGYAIPKDNRYLEGWPGFEPPAGPDSAVPVIVALADLFLDTVNDHTIEHPTLGEITLHRLREGIERFFITDINNPAASSLAQSELAAYWDVLSVAIQDFNHVPGGSNVLYMDGHVEFVRYPSEDFPVNWYMATIAQASGAT